MDKRVFMMEAGPPKYHRKSIRIQKYDYSKPGFYFVTICTKHRQRFFGEIRGGCMELSEGGKVVLSCWKEIPLHYPKVKLHPFIIMPNHIHGILEITPQHDGPHDGIPNNEPTPNNHQGKKDSNKPESGKLINKYQHIIPGSIGCIVRGFEIGVTKWFRKNTEIHTVWQRNFHDRVIRSPRAFRIISNYIINNPKNWGKDKFSHRN